MPSLVALTSPRCIRAGRRRRGTRRGSLLPLPLPSCADRAAKLATTMTRSPLVLLPEADFLCLEDVGVASLLSGGGTEARKRSRADDAAQTAEVELGEDLEDGDVVAVEVVEGKVADGGASDDNANASIDDLFNDLRMRLGGRSGGKC